MDWKNEELKKIMNEISMSTNDMERVKNKVDALISKINNELSNIKFTHTFIGSYSFKTIVNYDDENIDIDCMIIFSEKTFIKSPLDARKYVLKILKDYDNQTKTNIKIEEKEKVIQIFFQFNDETKNYHIDFPITFLVGGQKKLILINGKIEDTEADLIKEEFKNVFKENIDFHRGVIKLFKRWVKTNSNERENNSIPSIAILQSCIESNLWNHTSYLENLKTNSKNMLDILKNTSIYPLKWKPYNNVFEKKNVYKCKELLIRFIKNLENLESINDKQKFVKVARFYFLGEDDNERSIYGDKTSGA